MLRWLMGVRQLPISVLWRPIMVDFCTSFRRTCRNADLQSAALDAEEAFGGVARWGGFQIRVPGVRGVEFGVGAPISRPKPRFDKFRIILDFTSGGCT
jgi:hypothetical protein